MAPVSFQFTTFAPWRLGRIEIYPFLPPPIRSATGAVPNGYYLELKVVTPEVLPDRCGTEAERVALPLEPGGK